MSVQKTIQQKVIVSGKGETKQHAFASALAEIQNLNCQIKLDRSSILT